MKNKYYNLFLLLALSIKVVWYFIIFCIFFYYYYFKAGDIDSYIINYKHILNRNILKGILQYSNKLFKRPTSGRTF